MNRQVYETRIRGSKGLKVAALITSPATKIAW